MAAPNALNPSQVYLSREGRVFGPYSAGDLETFRQTGELMKYAWLWDGISERWTPIHAQPGRPVALHQPERNDVVSPDAIHDVSPGQIIRAVCYDNQGLVGGIIQSIDGRGAVVFCESDFRELGPFRKGQKVFVNLVEESSGKSENVGAVVTECQRHERGLMYRFEWQISPDLLVPRETP